MTRAADATDPARAQTVTVLYRYEDIAYAAPINETSAPTGPSRIEVHLREYPVVRTTMKGWWISVGGGNRFVLARARKRFACLTMKEAYASFIARKRREISIYQARIERAQQALKHLAWGHMKS